MQGRGACTRFRWSRAILAGIAGVVAFASPLLPGARAWALSVVSPPATFGGLAIAPDCSSDATKPLQAWLKQLPSNTTVDLKGACYQVDAGITITLQQGLIIENGTFRDFNVSPGNTHGHGTARGHPVFNVIGGSNIGFENLRFVGVNRGGYHPQLAFQAAIEIQGTIGVTLSQLRIRRVFGDGINLEPLRGSADHKSGQILNPTENVTISNVSIGVAGRQGITLASVNGVNVTNVTMTGIAMDAYDFEADQNNEGAKNVVINGCSYSKLLNISMQGPETGPITIENCIMPLAGSGWAVNIDNKNGKPDAGPIVFDHDIFNCGASVYVACFEFKGASNVTVENSSTTIGFPGDQTKEHAYSALGNTHVLFNNDEVSGYGDPGPIDATSTVAVNGGLWASGAFSRTATTFTQSAASVAYGSESTDTFAVTVTGRDDRPPTGTVTIGDIATATPVCVATLIPGAGDISTGTCQPTDEEFDAGTAFTTVTATYYGSGVYTDSESYPDQGFTVTTAPATTALTQTSSTVAYGSESADSFGVTVTGLSGVGAPTGTVKVVDAATTSTICTATLVTVTDDSSTAGCKPTGTEFPAGTAFTTVEAVYGGDADNGGSVSSPDQGFTVTRAPTTTALSQTSNTVVYGSESGDSFGVTVTGQTGVSTPTGTVTVSDNATAKTICTANLVPGAHATSTATCRPTNDEFPAGTFLTNVVATYSGDNDNAGSVSVPTQSFTVPNPVIPAPTTTALSQTSGTVAYGSESADSFGVTVTGQNGVATPTGTVTITDSATATTICTATLVTGANHSSASCSPTGAEFPVGTAFTTVAAVYGGDADNGGSVSSPGQGFTVTTAPTTTALSQSSNTVAYGSENADSFGVTVTGQNGVGAPTGTVTVVDAASTSTICTATLVTGANNSSTAGCSPAGAEFPAGTAFTTVEAVYGGDTDNGGSVSSPGQGFTVTTAPTTTALSQTSNTVAYGSESADSFGVTVTGQNGAGAPTGTVTISDNATAEVICTATLAPGANATSTGACSPTNDQFPAGTLLTTVVATYSGDSDNAVSVSVPAQSFTVPAVAPVSPTTTTLNESTATAAYASESMASFGVTVTGLGTAPTGTVNVVDSMTMSPICTATLTTGTGNSSTGTCSPDDVEFPAGTSFTTVVANYSGDALNATSVSSPDESFTVTTAPTVTALTQTSETVAYGSESADSFGVTITGQGEDGAPTGTVTIMDATTMSTVCSATLVASTDDSYSTAACNPTDEEFPAGTAFTSLEAVYGGDGISAGSVSSPAQSFTVTG
jgi:hypothetical protein